MEGKEYKEAPEELTKDELIDEISKAPELETEAQQDTKKPYYGRNTKADALESRMIELKATGLTLDEISTTLALPRSAVKKRLVKYRKVFTALKNVKDYTKYNSVMLRAVEFEILKNLADPKKLEKATIHNLAYAYKEIVGARRLEEGKSTSNISQQIFTRPVTSEFGKS